MDALNLNSLTVGADGRVSFSGLSSGIDFQAAVDAIIAARRIPVDRIESQITGNTDKITALQDLRTLMSGLKDSLSDLYGAVSVGNVDDVFSAKAAFATTTRLDGTAPSAASNLIGVTVSNSTALGSHNIEVLRVAKAHKISSAVQTSVSTALGISGTFSVNGTTITVTSTDTLQDIRDRINNANTGTNATKVSASIVTVSATENYLVLTADDTGTDMIVTDTGSVLSSLGLSKTNGAGGHRNGLATSKITTTAGFRDILFDGTQADNAFLVSYDQATKVMTLTRGDGTTDTATLTSTAIASGSTETVTFSTFGVKIVLDSNFSKTTDITIDADAASVTGGTGAVDANSVKISDSVGNVSSLTTNTLTFGNLATPSAISITAGGFSGTFDGTTTGLKTVNLTDGSGNTLQVQFNVTAAFSGAETAASITLNELKNFVGSTGTQFENELQKAVTARLTADGLVDPDRFESKFLSSSTAQMSSLTSGLSFPAAFDITVGGNTVTVSNILGTDTAADLVTKINNAITGSGGAVETAGTKASLVTDESGVRLVITDTTGAAITLTDTNGLLSGLGVDNNLVIERASNTIKDLFAGVTLSLFQAEEGTNIKVDVDRDLTSVKTQIQAFVDAYNALKVFLNTQEFVDPTTGQVTDQTGVLFGNVTVAQVEQNLAAILGQGTQGVDKSFSVLAQIGIDFVDNGSLSDPLQNDTLVIDESKLDSALLNNPDDVRKLFAFDFSSSDPQISLLGFNGKTSFTSAGYTLNIGNVGPAQETAGTAIVDRTAVLSDANSYGAGTTSGTLTINGTNIAYDVTTDSLDTLVTNINNAGIGGVTASVVTDSSGKFQLRLVSTVQPLTITETGGGNLLTKLNLQVDSNLVESANIDGAANGVNDGTATTNGKVITVTDQSGAEGLTLFYSGTSSLSGVSLNFTVGVGAQMFFEIDKLLTPTTGPVENEISSLEDQNKAAQERVDRMLERLDFQRERLLQRFVAMETALASLDRIRNSITQITDALNSKNN